LPTRSARPCAEHGCNELVYQGSRCDKHRLLRPPDTRPSAAERGYGWDWKTKVRDPFLKEHPWCTNPFGLHGVRLPAVMVDHKVPKKQGGADDWLNLQGLCKRCDNKKHYVDGSKAGGSKKVSMGARDRRGRETRERVPDEIRII